MRKLSKSLEEKSTVNSCPAQANFGGAHRTLPVNLHTPYYPDEEPRERMLQFTSASAWDDTRPKALADDEANHESQKPSAISFLIRGHSFFVPPGFYREPPVFNSVEQNNTVFPFFPIPSHLCVLDQQSRMALRVQSQWNAIAEEKSSFVVRSKR